MTYHLGSVDPDQGAELFADPRDQEPRSGSRRLLATMLGLLVMVLFAGGLWLIYSGFKSRNSN